MKPYKVRLLPSAFRDLQNARDWYRQHSAELPKRLSVQIDLSIERIRAAPFVYAVRYKDIRIANINIFPYGIHYLVNESDIVIIAIHHTALSPDKWPERL